MEFTQSFLHTIEVSITLGATKFYTLKSSTGNTTFLIAEYNGSGISGFRGNEFDKFGGKSTTKFPKVQTRKDGSEYIMVNRRKFELDTLEELALDKDWVFNRMEYFRKTSIFETLEDDFMYQRFRSYYEVM